MTPRAAPVLLAAGLAYFVAAGAAFAEMWPTLDDFAGSCVLVVRATAVGDPDDRGMRSFEVVETWKGRFRPSDFVQGVAGGRTLRARDGQHGVDVSAGQEIIFFYTRHNQPPDGLENHNAAFPVTGGKVVYAPTNRGLREEVTVQEFRRRVAAAGASTTKPATAPAER